MLYRQCARTNNSEENIPKSKATEVSEPSYWAAWCYTVDVNHYPRNFKNCCSVFLNVCYSQDGVAAQIAALLTNMEAVNHKTQIILWNSTEITEGSNHKTKSSISKMQQKPFCVRHTQPCIGGMVCSWAGSWWQGAAVWRNRLSSDAGGVCSSCEMWGLMSGKLISCCTKCTRCKMTKGDIKVT